MSKGMQRISVVMAVVLVISLFASFTTFAAEEKRIDKEGGFVTISNVSEVKKIEDTGTGDTVYVAEAPVTITVHGDYSESVGSGVTYLPDNGEPEDIAIKDSKVTLTKAGRYIVMFVFGRDFLPSNTAMFEVQVTGGSSTGESVDKPQPDTATVTKPDSKTETASTAPTTSKVLINGKEVSFEAYNISDNNYFKLRDLAAALNGSEKNFEVKWDGAKNAISLESGKAYNPVGGELQASGKLIAQTATATDSKIYLDDKEVQLTAYNIGGNNYFKLRDFGKLFNFGVTWNGKANTVEIDTSASYKDE